MKRFLTLLILFSFPLHAATKMLTYSPAVVELAGTLDLQTFPGPPSYESIKEGDEVERHFYLMLDTPVDVLPKRENEGVENAEEEREVKIVQLAVSEEDDVLWEKFRKLGMGGRVKIRGALFHRFTGHHHSRVLLGVTGMQPLLN